MTIIFFNNIKHNEESGNSYFSTKEISSFFENTHYSVALKAFRGRLFRMSWTLSFDIKIDKKNGASKEYIKMIRDEWKNVRNLKKPLPIEGKSYEELLSRAMLS